MTLDNNIAWFKKVALVRTRSALAQEPLEWARRVNSFLPEDLVVASAQLIPPLVPPSPHLV